MVNKYAPPHRTLGPAFVFFSSTEGLPALSSSHRILLSMLCVYGDKQGVSAQHFYCSLNDVGLLFAFTILLISHIHYFINGGVWPAQAVSTADVYCIMCQSCRDMIPCAGRPRSSIKSSLCWIEGSGSWRELQHKATG